MNEEGHQEYQADIPPAKEMNAFAATATAVLLLLCIAVGALSYMKIKNSNQVSKRNPQSPNMGIHVNTAMGGDYAGSDYSGSSPGGTYGATSGRTGTSNCFVPEGGIAITNASRGTGAGYSGTYQKDDPERGQVDIGAALQNSGPKSPPIPAKAMASDSGD